MTFATATNAKAVQIQAPTAMSVVARRTAANAATGTTTMLAGGNGSAVGSGAAAPLATMVAARLTRNEVNGARRTQANGAIDRIVMALSITGLTGMPDAVLSPFRCPAVAIIIAAAVTTGTHVHTRWPTALHRPRESSGCGEGGMTSAVMRAPTTWRATQARRWATTSATRCTTALPSDLLGITQS